jgi:hypothetical protein
VLLLVAGVCDHAAPVAHSETALAKIKFAAMRILSILHPDRALYAPAARRCERFPALTIIA